MLKDRSINSIDKIAGLTASDEEARAVLTPMMATRKDWDSLARSRPLVTGGGGIGKVAPAFENDI